MLKMDKLMDLIFEEMVLPGNRTLCVIYMATTRHLKDGLKCVVVAVAVATVTFQCGGYSKFKLNSLEKEFGDPHFLF